MFGYSLAHKAQRVLSTVFAAFISIFLMSTATNAGSSITAENPWETATDHGHDDGHGHLLRDSKSPFDELNELQLAAIPKGRRIHYNAPSKCVPNRLKKVLKSVAAKYGPITVNSTVRSRAKNRRIGGGKKSWHLKCAAVDFRVHARTKGLLSYLKRHPSVGGYKRYRSGFYHIDTGPKRTWR